MSGIRPVEKEQEDTVVQLDYAIDAFRESTNEFEIESKLYAIMRIAELAFERIHRINSASIGGAFITPVVRR